MRTITYKIKLNGTTYRIVETIACSQWKLQFKSQGSHTYTDYDTYETESGAFYGFGWLLKNLEGRAREVIGKSAR